MCNYIQRLKTTYKTSIYMRYKIFDNYQNYIMWITLTHSDMYMAQETFTN